MTQQHLLTQLFFSLNLLTKLIVQLLNTDLENDLMTVLRHYL